jgi:hypothetical protein
MRRLQGHWQQQRQRHGEHAVWHGTYVCALELCVDVARVMCCSVEQLEPSWCSIPPPDDYWQLHTLHQLMAICLMDQSCTCVLCCLTPPPPLHLSCSVSAKVTAEAEAERLRADNLALEACLRKMMEKEVRWCGQPPVSAAVHMRFWPLGTPGTARVSSVSSESISLRCGLPQRRRASISDLAQQYCAFLCGDVCTSRRPASRATHKAASVQLCRVSASDHLQQSCTILCGVTCMRRLAARRVMHNCPAG